ncbi:MAG: hypothetical protein WAK34_09800 [Rhodoplanes sp.]
MAPHTLEKGDFDVTEDPEKRLTAGAATDPPLGRGLALHCGVLATASPR